MEDQKAEALEHYLRNQIRYFNRNWIWNYYAGYACILGATAGSFVAGLLAATDAASPTVKALVAGLPGFLLVLYATFRFQSRSNWHARQTTRRRELLHGLRYESRSVEDVSKQLSLYNEEGVEDWVKMSELSPQGQSEVKAS